MECLILNKVDTKILKKYGETTQCRAVVSLLDLSTIVDRSHTTELTAGVLFC